MFSRSGSLVFPFLLCVLLVMQPALAEEGGSDEGQQPEKIEGPVATSMSQTIQGEGGITVQTMCTNCNSADLSLGSFGNEFLSVVCDGLPVPSGLAQIYLLSVVPPWCIDNVAVEKGAGRAGFEGGAIGGEIDVRRRAPSDGLQVNAGADVGDFGWSSTRAEVAGRTGWFGGSLVGTFAESDFVDADSDGTPDMASIDRTTWEGRLDLRPGERHRITLGATGYDESQADGRGGYDLVTSVNRDLDVWDGEQVDIDRGQYDLTYRFDFRDGSNLTAGMLYADRNTFIEEEQGATSDLYQPTYDIGEEQRHVRLGWFRPVGNRVVLRLGASRTEQEFGVLDYSFNRLQMLPSDFLLEESPQETGAWLEGEFSLGRGVRLFAGVRYADFEYTDNMEEIVEATFGVSPDWLEYDLPQGSDWLPRVALTWKPVSPLDLRFSYGEGLRQAPATHESVCCGRRFRGNRGIVMEESSVLGVEATYQPAPALQLIASAFRTEFDNLVVNLATWSELLVPTYQNVNVPEALYNSRGVELRWDAASWATVRASYSQTDATNRTPEDMIPVLYDNYGSPVPWWIISPDIPYVPESAGSLGLLLSHQHWGVSVDLSMQFSGPMTIQQFAYPDAQPVSISTPSFRVYNIRVSKALKQGFDLFLGVDNLGDYVQADLADPTTDYTWGPLRGTYVYGGATYRFATKTK